MRPAIAGATTKNLSGIQSRETAKKDSDEEAARRDSAEDLTGGGSAALTDRPDNQSGVTAKKRLIENGIYLVAITAKKTRRRNKYGGSRKLHYGIIA